MLSGTKNQLEAASMLNQELDCWQLVLRDMLTAGKNLDNLIINAHFKDEIKKLAARYSVAKTLMLLEQIKRLKQYLRYNVNPRLALENFMLNF